MVADILITATLKGHWLVLLRCDSPLASWPGPPGRNRCGGHGYSRACIYTSGTDKGCSHRTDIWNRAEGLGGGVGSQCGSAANTREHGCLMTNYLWIHYDYQQFADQCQSNKSIWRKMSKTEKQQGNKLTTCAHCSCRKRRWCWRIPGLSPWTLDRAVQSGGLLQNIVTNKDLVIYWTHKFHNSFERKNK